MHRNKTAAFDQPRANVGVASGASRTDMRRTFSGALDAAKRNDRSQRIGPPAARRTSGSIGDRLAMTCAIPQHEQAIPKAATESEHGGDASPSRSLRGVDCEQEDTKTCEQEAEDRHEPCTNRTDVARDIRSGLLRRHRFPGGRGIRRWRSGATAQGEHAAAESGQEPPMPIIKLVLFSGTRTLTTIPKHTRKIPVIVHDHSRAGLCLRACARNASVSDSPSPEVSMLAVNRVT